MEASRQEKTGKSSDLDELQTPKSDTDDKPILRIVPSDGGGLEFSNSGTAPDPEKTSKSISKDPFEKAKKLKNALERVNKQVVGMEDLLNQTLYALLTREHQLVYSRAGLAKSMYANAVFSQFEDAQPFTAQLTKGTPEEALVGGIIVEELKKGNFRHNIQGSIVEAKLAFLDEIFDANDVSLRSLLGVLNERVFRKGKQVEKAALHSAIATTNYLRQNDVTEAVIDRFLFRSMLLPTDDPYKMLAIDRAYEGHTGEVIDPADEVKVPFQDLKDLSDIVEGKNPEFSISCPAHILFMKNVLVHDFLQRVNEERAEAGQAELYLSPRTIAKMRDVLNASALLRGRSEVTSADLQDLKYVCVTIGAENGEEEHFTKALNSTLQLINKDRRATIDFLAEVDSLVGAIAEKSRQGKGFEPTFLDRIKLFFGLTNLGNLTFGGLKKALQDIEVTSPAVEAYRKGVIRKLKLEQKRLSSKSDSPLILTPEAA